MSGYSSKNDDPGEEMLEHVSGISSNEIHPFRVEFPSDQSCTSLFIIRGTKPKRITPGPGILAPTPSKFGDQGNG